MKFSNPKFEKVMFEDLDVILLNSLDDVDIVSSETDLTDKDFFD